MNRLLLVLLVSCTLHQAAAVLPAGFEDEGVVRLTANVDIAFAGNMMLAVTKIGELHRFDLEDPDATETTLMLDISARVCDNGERG